MIVAGLVASTIDGPEKWIYYGFAVLAFIPVLYYLYKLREQMIDNRRWDAKTGLLVDSNTGHFLPYIWFFNPIVWIFAEGVGNLSVTGEAITYAVLDLISKGVFGWIIVHANFQTPAVPFSGRMVDSESEPHKDD